MCIEWRSVWALFEMEMLLQKSYFGTLSPKEDSHGGGNI
jgi:hypothetical protein